MAGGPPPRGEAIREIYGIAADVLTAVRRTKALAKLSLRVAAWNGA